MQILENQNRSCRTFTLSIRHQIVLLARACKSVTHWLRAHTFSFARNRHVVGACGLLAVQGNSLSNAQSQVTGHRIFWRFEIGEKSESRHVRGVRMLGRKGSVDEEAAAGSSKAFGECFIMRVCYKS